MLTTLSNFERYQSRMEGPSVSDIPWKATSLLAASILQISSKLSQAGLLRQSESPTGEVQFYVV